MRRLDACEQAVERRDVAADCGRAERVRLDEGRARPDERVEDAVAGLEVLVQEDLDELRDELAEIRMQRVDVLRPLDLR